MKPDELKDTEDAALILAALAGNHQAFDELMYRYQRAMLAVAQQIVQNPIEAEDIVQDAFLLALEALPQLENLNKFGPWLYSITRYRALRFIKRSTKMQFHDDIDAELQIEADPATTDPAQIVEQNATHADVREAINALPDAFKEVIMLYYWADMPQKRIAETLSLPITTVKWRLHQGKNLLKTVLEKQGYGDIL